MGKTFHTKKLSSGDLLVEVYTKIQSDALLALNSLSDYEVSVAPHRTLNTVQGVISEDVLIEAPETEVVEGLSSRGAIAARRTILRGDGVKHKTRHIILTFAITTLPDAVKAGYLRYRVRPYVPNPVRCFKCQRFGFGSRNCRGSDRCAKCSSKEHLSDVCESNPKCANCDGKHAAYSRSCPLWKQEKEIHSKSIRTSPTLRQRSVTCSKHKVLMQRLCTVDLHGHWRPRERRHLWMICVFHRGPPRPLRSGAPATVSQLQEGCERARIQLGARPGTSCNPLLLYPLGAEARHPTSLP